MLIKSALRISKSIVCVLSVTLAGGLLAPLASAEEAPPAAVSVPTTPATEIKVEAASAQGKEAVKESPIPTLRAPGKIVVGVVSAESRAEFESKIIPFFKDQWANCSSCELRNLSTYDEKGLFNEKLFEKSLTSQPEGSLDGIQFLLLNVNWRYRADEHKTIVDALKKVTAKNTIILGAAGYPKDGESSAPLSRTILSQVPDLIIIGEINERERLLGSSYFGPEMLTAIKPPRDYVGKGLGPSFFAAKLAQNYTRKLPTDWLSHFRAQKMKSRKIWPQVEEFFQR